MVKFTVGPEDVRVGIENVIQTARELKITLNGPDGWRVICENEDLFSAVDRIIHVSAEVKTLLDNLWE